MIEAELFDGTVLEFPDGTPQDVIEKTVQSETRKRRPSLLAGATGQLIGGIPGSDEVGAAGGAVGDAIVNLARGQSPNLSQAFDENLGRIRSERRSFEERAPVLSTALNTAGALAIPASKGVGALRNLAEGATIGGISGALDAEGGAAERAEGALTGAGIGLGVGAAAELGGRALQGALSRRNPETRAFRQARRALEDDQVDLAQAPARLRDLGPEATIADVGGKNTRQLTRGVRAQPGPGGELIEQRLEERAARAGQRVTGATRSNIADAGFQDTLDTVLARRTQQADRLFQQARDEVPGGVLAGDIETGAGFTLDDLISGEKDIRNAIKAAQRGRKLNKADNKDIRVLQRAHSELFDLEQSLRRSGKNARASDVRQQRADLREAIKTEAPSFGPAVENFASESALLDAAQSGRKFINQDADVTAATLRELSSGEREMFLIGATRAIIDRVERAPDGVNVARRIFGNESMRNKIRTLFGDDEAAFNRFRRAMTAEQTFAEMRNRVLGGSQTDINAVSFMDFFRDPTAISDALQGNAGGLVDRGLRAGVEAIQGGPNPATTRRLADILVNTDQAANDRVLADMLARRTLERNLSGLRRQATIGGSVLLPQDLPL